MISHAQMAAQLLRDAANFFRSVAQGNPDVQKQMMEHADVFEEVANLVEADPTGQIAEEND